MRKIVLFLGLMLTVLSASARDKNFYIYLCFGPGLNHKTPVM